MGCGQSAPEDPDAIPATGKVNATDTFSTVIVRANPLAATSLGCADTTAQHASHHSSRHDAEPRIELSQREGSLDDEDVDDDDDGAHRSVLSESMVTPKATPHHQGAAPVNESAVHSRPTRAHSPSDGVLTPTSNKGSGVVSRPLTVFEKQRLRREALRTVANQDRGAAGDADESMGTGGFPDETACIEPFLVAFIEAWLRDLILDDESILESDAHRPPPNSPRADVEPPLLLRQALDRALVNALTPTNSRRAQHEQIATASVNAPTRDGDCGAPCDDRFVSFARKSRRGTLFTAPPKSVAKASPHATPH